MPVDLDELIRLRTAETAIGEMAGRLVNPHADRDAERGKVKSLREENTRLSDKIAALKAENERLREEVRMLASAIGEWSRPTSANGMVPAGENHPLCRAAARGWAALETTND